MADDSTRQGVLFSNLSGKPVVARFDQEHASSDGGAILLQACDRRLGLTEALIGSLADRRQPGKIQHALGDLVRQRLHAIACGYPDANDAGRLGSDPIQKLLCDRDPVTGESLASQPTLSRFENSVGRADLYRMGIALADTFFNGHYDTWCYLPAAGFLSFDADPDQYLFAYVLRCRQFRCRGRCARHSLAAGAQAAGSLPARAPAGAARWRLCRPADLRLPRARRTRVRGRDGQEQGT